MKTLTGIGAMIRVALRRDRIQLPLWIILTGGFLAVAVPTWKGVVQTEEDLRAAIELFAVNPAARLFGIASGGESIGEFVMLEAFATLSIVAGLMSFLLVVRHTRKNEDTRRAELIGSSVVGRHAGLAAALILAVFANVLLATAIAIVLIANGLAVTGSIAMSLGVAGVGISIAGVAAVTAQVYSTSRSASGMAGAVLAAMFVLSGAGNMLGRYDEATVWVHSAWPSWLSPIGWGQQMRPFAENDWWLLGLSVAFFLVLSMAAFWLATRRDFGMGLLPEKPGPARAAPGLVNPFGLVWRLQRGVFFGWAIGMVAFGVIYGSISGEIEGFMAESETARELFEVIGGTEVMLDAFIVAITGIIGMLLGVYILQVTLRMRREEADGQAEALLATALSRCRWMASYIFNALLGVTLLLFIISLSAGLVAGLVLGDTAHWLGEITAATVVYLPALMVLAGVVVAVFAFLPQKTAMIGWSVFAISVICGPIIGDMLDLPEAVLNLSPFTHIPQMPAESFNAAPLLIMLGVALGLFILGLIFFRRRNLSLNSG